MTAQAAVHPVMEVRDLRVYYHTPVGAVHAADGVNFLLRPRERLGLVGESGSGKTTTGMAIMRMIKSPGRIEGGQVLLDGQDLLALSEEEMRQVRFARVSLIPQGAMNSLNPVMRVGDQIEDIAGAHGQGRTQNEMAEHTAGLLRQVGLSPQVAHMFPHELSGGMKQRVCIAMAIACGRRVDHRRRADQRARRGGAAAGDGNARAGCRKSWERGGDPGRTRHGPDGPVRRPWA